MADWLVTNRQKIMLVKGDYIRESYGIHDDDAQFRGPFTYKEYCRNVLDKIFWGDALILYAVSCMWAVKISVVNSKTLRQYKVRHTAGLQDADIVLVTIRHPITPLLVRVFKIAFFVQATGCL